MTRKPTPRPHPENIKPLRSNDEPGELDSGERRQQLERAIEAKLGERGIEVGKVFLDPEKNTVIVFCSHITEGMKLFMTTGAVSLGSTVRDSMVSAHRAVVDGEKMGLMVVQCKECSKGGLSLLLGGD